MGETRVDLEHLLEDLRDAYPSSLEETILTEIIANSLDSRANRITMTTDPAQSTLTVADNGSGMQRKEMRQYHDIASSTKVRGQGIGFAGVGIKLGLLVCEEVLTETRRGSTHVATRWHLASHHRAPWHWVPPLGLVGERGTAVQLKLRTPLSPLVDPGFVEGAMRRHFQPLLEPSFDSFLASQYPAGIAFEINGRSLERHPKSAPDQAPLAVRLARRRKPSALGYLSRHTASLPEDQRGVAISTLGKVIKRGWDWLGVTSLQPDRINGLIEVPDLAASLTLNKGDFIRTGTRGAVYLAYRKAIQEAVSRQLEAWGDTRTGTPDASSRMMRPLERDLDRVLEELSDDFPLLASLVEHRAGGQKRLPIDDKKTDIAAGTEALAVLAASSTAEVPRPNETEPAQPQTPPLPTNQETALPEPATSTIPASASAMFPGHGRFRAPMRYGLGVQFEDRPDNSELGRLVESTVWINQAHPAYRRALASRSVGYHISLAVALALAPLAVEPNQEHNFITKFLSHWGQALDQPQGHRRRPRR
ncbi:MAG: ATP-binding protein [Nitrospiraceae bacterium]|nr:ATP-binding protein [Nitrospiraceae bacterium]